MKVAKLFIIALVMLPFGNYAQSVEVRKEGSRIESENVTGYQVTLTAPEEEVRVALTKYLKAIGRTKQSGDYITLTEPLVAGKKYVQTLYATTKSTGAGGAAWIGMQPDVGEEPGLDRDLEKLAYDFGVTFYKERIQRQIDESLRALQAVEKQQSRLVNQNKDLNNKIENNKREKIELEKSLVNNEIELGDLTKRLEGNNKAQDSVAVATEQIKKVVEMHKERQRKVR